MTSASTKAREERLRSRAGASTRSARRAFSTRSIWLPAERYGEWTRIRNSAFARSFFGPAASPLVEGNAVFVNAGGPNGAGLVAFEAARGNVLWTATSDDAGYSSPTAATIDGVRSILCFPRNGLAAADPATGK